MHDLKIYQRGADIAECSGIDRYCSITTVSLMEASRIN